MKAIEPDLTDRIADGLPADIRADFYREMRHCRSLPENDEMLRILRIMQFLTLLMERVPARIGVERERFEPLLAMAAESAQKSLESTEAYRNDIDQRLTALPDKIAQGIRPEIIAGKINESLGNSSSNPRFRKRPRHLRLSLQSCAKACPNSV